MIMMMERFKEQLMKWCVRACQGTIAACGRRPPLRLQVCVREWCVLNAYYFIGLANTTMASIATKPPAATTRAVGRIVIPAALAFQQIAPATATTTTLVLPLQPPLVVVDATPDLTLTIFPRPVAVWSFTRADSARVPIPKKDGRGSGVVLALGKLWTAAKAAVRDPSCFDSLVLCWDRPVKTADLFVGKHALAWTGGFENPLGDKEPWPWVPWSQLPWQVPSLPASDAALFKLLEQGRGLRRVLARDLASKSRVLTVEGLARIKDRHKVLNTRVEFVARGRFQHREVQQLPSGCLVTRVRIALPLLPSLDAVARLQLHILASESQVETVLGTARSASVHLPHSNTPVAAMAWPTKPLVPGHLCLKERVFTPTQPLVVLHENGTLMVELQWNGMQPEALPFVVWLEATGIVFSQALASSVREVPLTTPLPAQPPVLATSCTLLQHKSTSFVARV